MTTFTPIFSSSLMRSEVRDDTEKLAQIDRNGLQSPLQIKKICYKKLYQSWGEFSFTVLQGDFAL